MGCIKEPEAAGVAALTGTCQGSTALCLAWPSWLLPSAPISNVVDL